MIDFLGPGDGLLEGDVIKDGALEEAATDAVEVASIAATQVIKHRDFGLLGEMTCQVGADEARAAGDEDALAHARATSACITGS